MTSDVGAKTLVTPIDDGTTGCSENLDALHEGVTVPAPSRARCGHEVTRRGSDTHLPARRGKRPGACQSAARTDGSRVPRVDYQRAQAA